MVKAGEGKGTVLISANALWQESGRGRGEGEECGGGAGRNNGIGKVSNEERRTGRH